MKSQVLWTALASVLALGACEKKDEQAAKEPSAPSAAADKPATAPAMAAAAPAADATSREKTMTEMQAKLETVSGKLDLLKTKAETPANKANTALKEQLSLLTAKLDAARTDVKALNQTTEATWPEAKSKVEKNIQDIETTLEQASSRAVN